MESKYIPIHAEVKISTPASCRVTSAVEQRISPILSGIMDRLINFVNQIEAEIRDGMKLAQVAEGQSATGYVFVDFDGDYRMYTATVKEIKVSPLMDLEALLRCSEDNRSLQDLETRIRDGALAMLFCNRDFIAMCDGYERRLDDGENNDEARTN